jgi:hypothetical protein
MTREQQIRLWCLAGIAAALTALYFFLAIDNLLVHRFREVPFYIPADLKHSTLQGIGWTSACMAVAALSMAIRARNLPEIAPAEPAKPQPEGEAPQPADELAVAEEAPESAE